MTTADTTRLAVVEMTGTPPVIPATPAWQVARFTGESVAFQPTVIQSNELDPSGQVKDSVLTGGTTTGNINFEVSKNAFLESLLAAAFRNQWGTGSLSLPPFPPGTPTPVGTDQLIPGLILIPFAIEKRFQVVDNPAAYTFHRFAPSGVESLSITITPGAAITGTAAMSGGVQSLAVAELAGSTYVDGGDEPVMTAPLVDMLNIDTGTVQAQCLSNFVMTFTSNLRAIECIGTLGPRELLLGKFVATMTGTMYYNNDEIVQKFIDQAEFPVVVEIKDSKGASYKFTFPVVKATAAPVVAGGTGQDVVVDLAMTAIFDSDTGYTCLVERATGP